MFLSIKWILHIFVLCNLYSTAMSTLEYMQPQEVKQLLIDEKYVVILLSDGPSCNTYRCKMLEETLVSIREDVVESLNCYVVRTHSAELNLIYGLTEVKQNNGIVLVRSGNPVLYYGPDDDDEYMMHFIVTNSESSIRMLTDNSFEHETQAASGATTGDWLVMFTKAGCDSCNYLRSTVEAVASNLAGRKNVAIIDREAGGGQTTRRFGVKKFPSFIMFRLGRLYRFNLPIDAASLIGFSNDAFRNVYAETIPLPKTPFDDLVEQCADWLHENPGIVNAVLYGVVGFIVLIVIAVISGSRKSKPTKSTKSQESKKKK